MRRKPCLDFVLPGYVATWADREERVEGGVMFLKLGVQWKSNVEN